MEVVTKNKYTEETRRWLNHIPPGATKLFIGTFPTNKPIHDFFYSSATNPPLVLVCDEDAIAQHLQCEIGHQ